MKITWIDIFLMVLMLCIAVVLFLSFAVMNESRFNYYPREKYCRQNLDQLGRSMSIYYYDIGFYPRRDGAGFLTILYQEGFLQEPLVFLCPVEEFKKSKKRGVFSPAPKNREEILAQHLSSLQTPETSQNNIIGYAGRKNGDPSVYPGIFTTVDSTQTPIVSDDWQGEKNHDDRTIILFLDGHVDFAKDEDLGNLLDPLDN